MNRNWYGLAGVIGVLLGGIGFFLWDDYREHLIARYDLGSGRAVTLTYKYAGSFDVAGGNVFCEIINNASGVSSKTRIDWSRDVPSKSEYPLWSACNGDLVYVKENAVGPGLLAAYEFSTGEGYPWRGRDEPWDSVQKRLDRLKAKISAPSDPRLLPLP
jgi:hypothetical protein